MCTEFIWILLSGGEGGTEGGVAEREHFQENGPCQDKVVVFLFQSIFLIVILQAIEIVHFVRIASGNKKALRRI